MKKIKLMLALLLCAAGASAQQVVKLYPEGTSELHIYRATENANGKAVVICPGGGYSHLAFDHEGKQAAQWFNEQGITAVILKYRMPDKHKDIPLADGQEAMRYVRRHAKELGVDPTKVGVAGFSAGGHLAATLSTHFDTRPDGISTRPDFSILFYPVITMTDATHRGSRNNLLGEKPTAEDIYRFSCENQVSVNTPRTILLLSDDDRAVPVANSLSYYQALKHNNIPAALYIYPCGGHGWGFRPGFAYAKEMRDVLGKWLKSF